MDTISILKDYRQYWLFRRAFYDMRSYAGDDYRVDTATGYIKALEEVIEILSKGDESN